MFFKARGMYKAFSDATSQMKSIIYDYWISSSRPGGPALGRWCRQDLNINCCPGKKADFANLDNSL